MGLCPQTHKKQAEFRTPPVRFVSSAACSLGPNCLRGLRERWPLGAFTEAGTQGASSRRLAPKAPLKAFHELTFQWPSCGQPRNQVGNVKSCRCHADSATKAFTQVGTQVRLKAIHAGRVPRLAPSHLAELACSACEDCSTCSGHGDYAVYRVYCTCKDYSTYGVHRVCNEVQQCP